MRVFLDSIGCRLNQSEIEKMAAQFRQTGHDLTPSPGKSELIVLNTCAVTASAGAESRNRVRKFHRINPEAEIVLTGCWSSVEPEKAINLPGVAGVVPNNQKSHLVPDLLGQGETEFDREPLLRKPIPGIRMRTRAFIKVQDGCDHRCTFCITTIARGSSRSIPVEQVLADVEAAVSGGSKEVILTGVSLSSYGNDLQEKINLKGLVEAILTESSVPRIRLSSLEPWGLPKGFFSLWRDPRMCRHLHLPLQSGSPSVLRRMGRPITPEGYRSLILRARREIPDLAVTTDLMVGFPGESQEEFEQSLNFVEKMEFADAHTFRYSPRPGTAALKISPQVQSSVARSRSALLSEIVRESRQNFLSRFTGSIQQVLWIAADKITDSGWRSQGVTDNDLKVQAIIGEEVWNRITQVKITGHTGDMLQGEPH